MSAELESCPLCGALPADQVDSDAVEQRVRNRYKFSRQEILDDCTSPARATIIEVMARAMDCPAGQEYMPVMREFAARALAALSAEGMAVVPVEPTEAMLDNGGGSIIRPSIYMGGTPPGAKRRARDVWAAMLAAHTQEKDA